MRARREPRHRTRYRVAAVLVHIVLVAVVGSIVLLVPTDAFGLLGAVTMILISSFLTAVYLHNFGTERVGTVRAGAVGLDRGYLVFLMWMVFGYLAVLFLLGPVLGPDGFVLGLAAWGLLVLAYVAAVVVWAKQDRRTRASRLRRP